MYKNSFLKVASVTPKLKVANPEYNVNEMLNTLKEVKSSIAVFPELGITAYTCNDLFFQTELLKSALKALKRLLKDNPYEGIMVAGLPLEIDDVLYNVALIIQKHAILGVVPKMYLPNTQEFYEKRWFTSARDIIHKKDFVHILGQKVPFGPLVFQTEDQEISFGVEICEDMWAPVSPGNLLALQGAKIILNLSASNEYLNKRALRRNAILDHSRRNAGAYVYSSAGVHESTSETVFSGHNLIAQNGKLIVETERFSQETEIIYADLDLSGITYNRKMHSSYRDTINRFDMQAKYVGFKLKQSSDYQFHPPLDKTPFVPKKQKLEVFEKIAHLQETALIKRINHIGSKTIVVGVSGGLDSTLALLIAARVFDKLKRSRKEIIGLTLPALATGDKTLNQARDLMKTLKITWQEIDLKHHVKEHFKLIDQDEHKQDITYENVQARARTMILMNMANKHDGLVLGTGDMSELALGWCTYSGDLMSMYGINAGLPKTLVRFMIEQYAKHRFDDEIQHIAKAIIDTPISPELLPNQTTESVLGLYDINDFILHRFLRFGDTENRIQWLIEKAFKLSSHEASQYVERFFKRFYSQQYKRQATPDAPKILDISLSPRSDFRMPSDVSHETN